MPFHQSYENLTGFLASKQNLNFATNSRRYSSWLLFSVANFQQFIAAAVKPRFPWRLEARTFCIRNVKPVHQCQAMSDVFSSLCLLGRNKKKNSVSNSITVVGVKKALLLGKIFLYDVSCFLLHKRFHTWPKCMAREHLKGQSRVLNNG